ncbi:DNRLRE domain-containing protein [Candidatus Woesearchaeota archaeon]|nr:DNRLRE domain-containing protein [Candidatus Woesearchaeota archaeon]
MNRRKKNKFSREKKLQISIFFCSILLIAIVYFIFPFGGITGLAVTSYQYNSSNSSGIDTYLKGGVFSGQNYGSQTELIVGQTAASSHRSLFLFENITDDIVSTDTIQNATLEFFVFSVTSSTSITVNLHRVTNSWNESEATYDDRGTGVAWDAAGGDYEAAPIFSTEIGATGWYTFNLTALVQGWVNGSYTNNGLLLVADNTTGELKSFNSSDVDDIDFAPNLTINHIANAEPVIDDVSDDSNSTSPTNVGNDVNFTVDWSDLDSTTARLYVCDNATIDVSGCANVTFCSTGNATTDPVSCTYTTYENDTSVIDYFVAMCDDGNACSSASGPNNFSVNHRPLINITRPNGDESFNQTELITFDVNDSDNDTLEVYLYYSDAAGDNDTLIVANYVLNETNCDIGDFTQTNNCSYSWNTSELSGNYFIDANITDTFLEHSDSSDSSFTIVSVTDITPPTIAGENITEDLSSGELADILATVNDSFLSIVWVGITNTSGDQRNFTMVNEAGDLFNFTFGVEENETWEFTVYANDSSGNEGNGTNTTFTVFQPNGTAENEVYPELAQHLSTVRISGDFNATDLVVELNATLIIEGNFVFLNDYPNITEIGNLTENSTGTATWFVSTPNTGGNYTLNISYQDRYYNNWTSNNLNVNVTGPGGDGSGSSSSETLNGTFIELISFPEVEAGNVYTTEIYIRDSGGNLTGDATDIKANLIDPTGNFITENVSTTELGLGRYNYSYTTASGNTQGFWTTLVYATRNNEEYLARDFWKLTGGPFDVRDISVADNIVPDLQISVILENTGNNGQDMVVNWNLTRTDTDAELDSGQDTVFVAGSSTKTHVVTPSTSFEGNVKITFLGFYGSDFTERAGATETFTTVSAVAAGAAPSFEGGARGTGTKRVPDREVSIEFTDFPETVEVEYNGTKQFNVALKNTGAITLHEIELELQGLLPQWYNIAPENYSSILPDEIKSFNIELHPSSYANPSIYPFNYVIKSREGDAVKKGKLRIKSISDTLIVEVRLLERKLNDLEFTLEEAKSQGYDIFESKILIDLAKKRINEVVSLLQQDEIIFAQDGVAVIKKYMEDAEKQLGLLGFKVLQKPKPLIQKYLVWIITWILIILVIAVGYLLYKKLNLMKLLQWRKSRLSRQLGSQYRDYQEYEIPKSKGKEEDYEKKLMRIRDELLK